MTAMFCQDKAVIFYAFIIFKAPIIYNVHAICSPV